MKASPRIPARLYAALRNLGRGVREALQRRVFRPAPDTASSGGSALGARGEALDQQFERWGLSPAEKEVALLLLKGLSHKDIAEVRSVTEATARQQARAVYKKGGLSGRHDLAAFFLEDLMLPME